ncbi:hypothetical protein C8A03DRAFT_45242 [Achaetomium macrosporum]|uniref:EKC/KEOPS complex subunit BUD32 n=1 Tax=Achaetomium macrosporum TaxID=79813 RepID=A0AAN7C7J9_9PEZI|nr:hypothetical protein C8A03DRAFT_45242 [Achaetomium macrosporum]
MARPSAQRKLFNPFRGTVYLNRGAYGHIFRLAGTVIVVKIAHRIINSAADEEARAAENLKILRQERAVYEELATKPPHPNVVQRLSRRFTTPIPEEQRFCWIKEIASAASWLESFDYFHGDLRPENILLDETEHVKVCDFGRAQKRGCKVEVATYPFYRPGKIAAAGHAHEQFAIGSCIYTIRTGEVPYGQWETPADSQRMYEALVRGIYPPTEDDSVLGHIVSSCWRSSHDSMEDEGSAVRVSREDYEACVRRCQEFLAQQGQEYGK